MPVVFGGICPHGFSVVGEVAGKDLELFKPIRGGMEEFGKRYQNHQIDTIILFTPHGLRVTGHSAVYQTASCRGTLSQYGLSVSLEYLCDQTLANEIYQALNQTDIPVVGCNFGAMSGELSTIPMDWGTLIPLWFTPQENKPKLVVIAPTRETSYDHLVEMGRIIGEIAKKSDKNIAIIASADQGHCHDEKGPYGYAPESKQFDEKIIDIITESQFEEIYDINPSLIEKGKPDSISQLLILHGILQINPLKGSFITYQCPTYFGMLVASYE